MTTDALKLAADKHMARSHGYKLKGEPWKAIEHTQIAYHLTVARQLIEKMA